MRLLLSGGRGVSVPIAQVGRLEGRTQVVAQLETQGTLGQARGFLPELAFGGSWSVPGPLTCGGSTRVPPSPANRPGVTSAFP